MKIKIITKGIFLKAVCWGCIFYFFLLNIYAQNQKKIDSLKWVIVNTQSDTVKLKALVMLNEINQNRKELLVGYKQQIALSRSTKEYSSSFEAYCQLGYYEFENNNFIAAENILKEGMELARQTDNYFAMGRCSANLMRVYDKKGDMATAIIYLNQAEQLLIKVDKKVNLARHYCNASEMFKNHSLLSKSLEYARKGYATAQSSGDLEPMTTASWFLATSLQTVGKYDSAIYYFSQGLQIAQKLGLVYTQGDMLRGLAHVYAEIKEYKIARSYLKNAIAKYESVNVTDRKIDCEESLAFLDFMNKDFSKVKDYLSIREKKVTEDSLINKQYVYKWFANLALIDQDVETWKKYSGNYERLDAVRANDKIQKTILELEAKYNLSKKESELLQKDTENRKRLWIIAALALAMITIIVIAVTQYRNYKNKQKIAIQKSIIEKQNALTDERFRIAADMHDDVGAGLSRIRYISSSMQSNRHVSDGDINKIVSLSDEAVEKMNEIIWALNQGNQQLEELIYYIRSQCSEMINNAGVAFSFELPENFPGREMEWKDCRNIYLLVKEAVNNAIKHAGATLIIIECSTTEKLQFSITDNGNGFDPGMVKNGNGFFNYKKRLEKLNGTYRLTTALGEGTKIIFDIPFHSPIL